MGITEILLRTIIIDIDFNDNNILLAFLLLLDSALHLDGAGVDDDVGNDDGGGSGGGISPRRRHLLVELFGSEDGGGVAPGATTRAAADAMKNDAADNSANGSLSRTPLALAWHCMSSCEDMAHRYELHPSIYEAITESVRIKPTVCEAIEHAVELTSAHDYWHSDRPPEGLFDLFEDFAEYG